ncbi:hypothetical protein HS088_TW13G00314 [Tripterygium wilfordii]|uniref:DUF7148 domain-containing protein n=1 Tax=Tripterygium wilfordii TaxID=458696 RepID=A0A7J7CTR8_TRIWF|nr:uncharacterized protein LOC120011755 [Tripterygium wilfordii]KAF5737434.1 hypothetical protein HS088_TW13G00314 [Tripterygium wilfordii]
MACATRQLLHPFGVCARMQPSSTAAISRSLVKFSGCNQPSCRLNVDSVILNLKSVAKSLPDSGGVVSADDNEDGVSLGTMKLPSNIDFDRLETLLFQWANSLCQGANLPLPVPLKVDKIPGGARLGFITIGDGKTELLVYIDCLVFPATAGSGPIFRAIRNGALKDKSPPGEPRIMRSLLAALKKSIEIARV